MSFIGYLMGGGFQASDPVPNNRDPSDDFWYSGPGVMSRAGQAVTHQNAMQASAVYASVKLLSETLAMLPFSVFRRLPNGDSEKLAQHPVTQLLDLKPNRRNATAFHFKARLMAHLCLRGNAYARILPGPMGPVSELMPLHPDFVTPRLADSGRVIYDVRGRRGGVERLNQDEVLHLRALALDEDGICGLDPIAVAMREAIGMALGAQDYGARFLANDATPTGVLEMPGHFVKDEDRRSWMRRWRAEQSGANRHSTALMEKGITYKPIAMTNEQAQFLETRKHSDVEIARLFGVQPHKIGIMDRATFSNIEQQSIEFVTDTMLPWFVNWEQTIETSLVFSDDDLFVKFNVAALLRGDTLARYQSYQIGRNGGWLSANDVRRSENMNSIGADGDVYLQPLNMQKAEETTGQPSQPAGQPAAVADLLKEGE